MKRLGEVITVIGNTLLVTVMAVFGGGIGLHLWELYNQDRFALWCIVGFLGTIVTGIVCLEIGRRLRG